MTYAEKAKELISTTDGLVDIAMGLNDLLFDADKEVAESKEMRVNLAKHIEGQKIWIKLLRKDIENSIPKERVEALIKQFKSDIMIEQDKRTSKAVFATVTTLSYSTECLKQLLSNQTKQGESNE